MPIPFKKLFLVLLDGFGLAIPSKGNAIFQADMQYLNSLIDIYPSYSLMAASLIVGLPSGKFGNSEVGHSTIGTGRIVTQDWARINNAIKDESFFKNPAFISAIEHCRKNNSKLHISGCFSDGGIHSHEDHFFALIDLTIREKFNDVFLHLITDGKDTSGIASLESLARLQPWLEKSTAKIASLAGRKFGMDRVYNWNLTGQVWDAMVHGKWQLIENVKEYIEKSHKSNIFDDELVPAVVSIGGKPVGTVGDNDAIIFMDYRNDRIEQLATLFTVPTLKDYDRGNIPKNLFMVTMTPYSNEIPVQAIAYNKLEIKNTLGDVFAQKGLKQIRIAEQEKKAHVTSFFDGGRLEALPNSEHLIINSEKISQNQLAGKPEMAASQIVETTLKKINEDITFYAINFANCDMVAHTGNLEATIKALKIVDNSLKTIVPQILSNPEYGLIITCDHGNSEELIDPLTGGQDTQHSANNVPCIILGDGLKIESTGIDLEVLSSTNPQGSLIDVAPTVLRMLGFEKPEEMTGQSLI